MKFRATIRKEGKPDETRVVEAPSRFAVYDLVRGEGGFVTLITEERGFNLSFLSKINFTIGTGVKQDQLITMTKNLGGMLKAGLSLSRALSVIGKQSGGKQLKKIVAGIEESVRTGSSFHEALNQYPRVFPTIYRAMTRAGEESGTLAESLAIIGTQMEHTSRLIKKVKGALMYPAIILVAIAIVFTLMMIYVVPTLTKTFAELHVELPLATRAIAAISDFMANHTLLLLAGIALVVVGLYLFVHSKRGSNAVLRASLYVPVIGELVRETFSARAARTMASLLSSGVPVLSVLEITSDVIGKNVFGDVIEEAHVRVKKGDSLSLSFVEHSHLYPIFMSDMLAVGEETGNLAGMLGQVAEFYEADVEERTKDLSSIIEPLIMLVVGAGVGIFAVAMISPIYSLSSAI
jgi:type IV pilus assembly protein PilC